MGDDGIGCLLALALASDPRLPRDVEIVDGGSDLLACAGRMEGRERVTLVDAILDPAEPGAVHVFEDDFSALETGQPGAHALSAVAALQLLRFTSPELRLVRFKLITVAIGSAVVGQEPSPELASKLPQLLDRVLRELVDDAGPDG